MKIPNGYTEQEVLDIIDKVSNGLARKFKFGYHEIEDMKQQAAMFAWEGLENYDGVRPLENFLWVHVKNRLFNFKRNNYVRIDKPCDKCPLAAFKKGKCTAYTDMMDCSYYNKWIKRNEAKKGLMSTKEYDDVYYKDEEEFTWRVIAKQALDTINAQLPLIYREDWLRFINGNKLAKNKRDNLILIITEILKENGIDEETW